MTTDDSGRDPNQSAPEQLTIQTEDGLTLEAELVLPQNPSVVTVLCHPHPLHGGSMAVPIFDRLMTELAGNGIGALRFNFRGVLGSQGNHGYGDDEQLDVTGAVAALAERAPGVPVVAVGWSFGADVALTCVAPSLAGWFLIAPPLRSVPIEDMAAIADERPKVLAIPAHDQFNPPKIAEDTTADWANTRVEVIEGTDHFLNGKVDAIAGLATEFARSLAR